MEIFYEVLDWMQVMFMIMMHLVLEWSYELLEEVILDT